MPVVPFLDNKSDGNCLYLAYAISLMHFLKAELSPEAAKNILVKFNLTQKDEQELLAMLANKNEPGFSKRDITRLQDILAQPLRDYAAQSIVDGFKNKPLETLLYAVLNNTFSRSVKLELLKQKSARLAGLIDLGDIRGREQEYAQAEIFRMRGTKKAMNVRAKAFAQELIKKYPKGSVLSKKQKEQMESELSRLPIIFMCENSEAFLTGYQNYLRIPNRVWGTTEELYSMHNKIIGERVVRDPATDRVETVIDTNINLQVKHGHLDNTPRKPLTHMILRNLRQNHWVSHIPASVQLKLLHKGLTKENYSEVYQLTTSIDKHIESITSYGTRDAVYQIRMADVQKEIILQSILDKMQSKRSLSITKDLAQLKAIEAECIALMPVKPATTPSRTTTAASHSAQATKTSHKATSPASPQSDRQTESHKSSTKASEMTKASTKATPSTSQQGDRQSPPHNSPTKPPHATTPTRASRTASRVNTTPSPPPPTAGTAGGRLTRSKASSSTLSHKSPPHGVGSSPAAEAEGASNKRRALHDEVVELDSNQPMKKARTKMTGSLGTNLSKRKAPSKPSAPPLIRQVDTSKSKKRKTATHPTIHSTPRRRSERLARNASTETLTTDSHGMFSGPYSADARKSSHSKNIYPKGAYSPKQAAVIPHDPMTREELKTKIRSINAYITESTHGNATQFRQVANSCGSRYVSTFTDGDNHKSRLEYNLSELKLEGVTDASIHHMLECFIRAEYPAFRDSQPLDIQAKIPSEWGGNRNFFRQSSLKFDPPFYLEIDTEPTNTGTHQLIRNIAVQEYGLEISPAPSQLLRP